MLERHNLFTYQEFEAPAGAGFQCWSYTSSPTLADGRCMEMDLYGEGYCDSDTWGWSSWYCIDKNFALCQI